MSQAAIRTGPLVADDKHETECTDCHSLFECWCGKAAVHAERKHFGWRDLCPSCNRKEQESWFRHLASLPETRIPEKVGNRG